MNSITGFLWQKKKKKKKNDHCSWFGGKESKPKTTKCFSAHRDVPIDDIKSYWPKSVAVPVMDNLIAQLTERLSDRSHASLFMLLPAVMFSHNDEIIKKKLQEIANILGLETNYATRKDFLQEMEKPRKHLPVLRQQ